MPLQILMLLHIEFYFQNADKVSISVGTIILGAFIAGARDLSFDFYGYSIVILSNITNAINLACIAQTGNSSSLSCRVESTVINDS